MNESVAKMIIEKIESMGYTIGIEVIELLKQYYPIVRRRLLTSNLIWLIVWIGFIVAGVLSLRHGLKILNEEKKKKDFYRSYNEVAWIVPGVVSLVVGILFSIFCLVNLINLDYYTIQKIIEQIQNFS